MRACIKKETQVIYSGVGQVYFSVRLLQLCCHDKAQQMFTFDSDVCIFFIILSKLGLKQKKKQTWGLHSVLKLFLEQNHTHFIGRHHCITGPRRDKQRQTTIHTHTHTYGQEFPIHLTLWGKSPSVFSCITSKCHVVNCWQLFNVVKQMTDKHDTTGFPLHAIDCSAPPR